MPDNKEPDRRETDRLDTSFKKFHELMSKRVQEILLISSPYDAFIMEEDGRLAGRIIHEYRGLNLTRPPRITWVSSAHEALRILSEKQFDLVITMPRLDDMSPTVLCGEIKRRHADLPIYYLSHETARFQCDWPESDCGYFDRQFIWLGNTDLLLALVKNTEDQLNVVADTEKARVRVILLVEDSPLYLSSILPLIYKEIVKQTQYAMDESLNEAHRILRMRGRPKILVAGTYEKAVELFDRFMPYILTVLSDVRFPSNGVPTENAGLSLLMDFKRKKPDMPLLLLSSESLNREKALQVPAHFIDKNSPSLHHEIRSFFKQNLGFDAFVFRLPSGEAVGSASNLREMSLVLDHIPDASVEFHAGREDFSTWMMARMEIELAQDLRKAKVTDFSSIAEVRTFILNAIRRQRSMRQRGVVVEFAGSGYDPTAEFVKIGNGSLGGKARGLAFMAAMLKDRGDLAEKFPSVRIRIPRTLVISTEGFESFISHNNLELDDAAHMTDAEIETIFTAARFPEALRGQLASFLEMTRQPLAIRSSSLLEDAQAQASAGVYRTYMIPNNHSALDDRLSQLLLAIKKVYASTYFAAPRAFADRSPYRTEEDRMAVIIQPVAGQEVDGLYYPAISGVAQSYNFYPVSYMKPEEGIAHIVLGLGRAVVDGEACLRFSPKYPQLLPQMDNVQKALQNTQRYFFALKTHPERVADPDRLLSRQLIDDATGHPAVKLLAGTYSSADQRIRDSGVMPGQKVMNFASVLKYNLFPLADILNDMLEIGRKGMGGPVEIEFAVTLPFTEGRPYAFYLLQMRPMGRREQQMRVTITADDEKAAFCYSPQALGNGLFRSTRDILYVAPERFDPARTVEIATEIAGLNRLLADAGRHYILIGPGRWGSADPWLGIPVAWSDISAVAAIVETKADNLQADPSQGSHFFHNITTLGIGYLTVAGNQGARMDWDWLRRLPTENEGVYVRHAKCPDELLIKIDGTSSTGVILAV